MRCGSFEGQTPRWKPCALNPLWTQLVIVAEPSTVTLVKSKIKNRKSLESTYKFIHWGQILMRKCIQCMSHSCCYSHSYYVIFLGFWCFKLQPRSQYIQAGSIFSPKFPRTFANAILKVAVGFCTLFSTEKRAFAVFHWKPLLYFSPDS